MIIRKKGLIGPWDSRFLTDGRNHYFVLFGAYITDLKKFKSFLEGTGLKIGNCLPETEAASIWRALFAGSNTHSNKYVAVRIDNFGHLKAVEMELVKAELRKVLK